MQLTDIKEHIRNLKLNENLQISDKTTNNFVTYGIASPQKATLGGEAVVQLEEF